MEAAALIEGLVPPIISHLEIKCAECGTFLVRIMQGASDKMVCPMDFEFRRLQPAVRLAWWWWCF